MSQFRSTPTEECPLTKTEKECSFSDYLNFQGINGIFGLFTLIVTVCLMLQVLYHDNAFEITSLHGAVTTDHVNCTEIGANILKKGGNAIDATVAASICMTVVAPYKTGLGSGGYIMIYNRRQQEKPIIIDFLTDTVTPEFSSVNFRIPALLRGLEFAHKLFGKLPWADVVNPSATLARRGFKVSKDFVNDAEQNKYSHIFKRVRVGETLILPILADTLQAVAMSGTNIFYSGAISSKFFKAVPNKSVRRKLLQQMADYHPILLDAQNTTLLKYTILHPPNMKFVQFMIDNLNHFSYINKNASLIDSEIAIAQTFLKSNIGNAQTNYTQNRKYAGISSVDRQGGFASVVTGLTIPLNLSYKTEAGFYFDTADKKALLSLTPIMFYDSTSACGLRGTFSTDSPVTAGQILYNLLLKRINVSSAIEYPRFYLLSDGISVENDAQHSVNPKLKAELLESEPISQVDANVLSRSVNAIVIEKKSTISAHSDTRGNGQALIL